MQDPNIVVLFPIFMFTISLLGMCVSKNIIKILLSAEFLLFSASLMFILFSIYYCSPEGQIYALLLLSVAVSDMVIGLCLILIFNRLYGLVELGGVNSLKE